MDETECQLCEGELEELKWKVSDGYGRPYGYSCERCAEGAFDRYYESMVE